MAHVTPGAAGFLASISQAAVNEQGDLRRLHDWAVALEHAQLARLETHHGEQFGKPRWSLRCYARGRKSGLVTVWHQYGAALSLHWDALDRDAPIAAAKIRRLLPDSGRHPDGKRRASYWGLAITQDLLNATREAYQEHARGRSEF